VTDRYDGKPFLRLLDCYVLDTLGALDDRSEAALIAMEPRLRAIYNANGGWREIVAAQMDFPDDMPDQIRRIWDDGHDRFVAAHGQDPDPLAFTTIFVDTNFVPQQAGEE
jgi:hypothetical protein